MIPPWQSPDEPAHFSYTAHIAEQAELPYIPLTATLPLFSRELEQSLALSFTNKISNLGAGGSPSLSVLPSNYDYAAAQEYEAPPQQRRNAGGASATPYSPVYYLLETIPYLAFKDSSILSRLYAMRVGTAMLGALACVFAYLIGHTLYRSRLWGYTLGIGMAFMPMLVFMTASVNNDALMVLSATALIWAVIRIFNQPELSRRAAVVLGLLSALTLLSKPTAFPISAVATLAIAWQLFLAWRGQGNPRKQIGTLAAYAISFLAAYSPYLLLQRYFAHQIALALADSRTASANVTSAATTSQPTLEAYLTILHEMGSNYYIQLMLKSFWGVFGWLDVGLPEELYSAFGLLCVVGFVCCIAQTLTQSALRGVMILMFLFIVVQILFVYLGADYYFVFSRTGERLSLQGRYFFPVIAPVLLLLFSGWYRLFNRRPAILLGLVAFMGIAQVVSLVTIVSRYYGIVIV